MPSVIPAAWAIRAAEPAAMNEAALALRKLRRSSVKSAMLCPPLFFARGASRFWSSIVPSPLSGGPAFASRDLRGAASMLDIIDLTGLGSGDPAAVRRGAAGLWRAGRAGGV